MNGHYGIELAKAKLEYYRQQVEVRAFIAEHALEWALLRYGFVAPVVESPK